MKFDFSFMHNDPDKILNNLIRVIKEIKKIEDGELKSLIELKKTYTEQLEDEMRRRGVKKFENQFGRCAWVDRVNKGKLDEEKLCKEYGIPSLTPYKTPDTLTSYLKTTVKPDINS